MPDTSISADFFLNHPPVRELIEKARAIKADPNRIYSDVVDDAGYQYADLVQEGGGVLGIALLGYTHIMEEAGIRFYDLTGTSADAINTLMMASIGKLEDPKSVVALEALSQQNLFDFVDGNPKIKKTIQYLIEGKDGRAKRRLIFQGLMILGLLRTKLGMNPGVVFNKWLEKILEKQNIRTTKDLTEKRVNPAGFRERNSGPFNLILDGSLSPPT